jgi:hypothetical protein
LATAQALVFSPRPLHQRQIDIVIIGMERIAAALGVSENGPSEFKFDIAMIL